MLLRNLFTMNANVAGICEVIKNLSEAKDFFAISAKPQCCCELAALTKIDSG